MGRRGAGGSAREGSCHCNAYLVVYFTLSKLVKLIYQVALLDVLGDITDEQTHICYVLDRSSLIIIYTILEI